MAEIIGVRFKEVGKIYYFDPNGGSYRVGEPVVVETSRGTECGTVAISNREVDQTRVVKPLKKVTRPATQEDLRRVEENHKKEEKAFRIAQEKIALCKLEMKLVEVEYAFDGSKILFYFTADGRVDFRELVKELRCSRQGSSCGRSACGTRRKCWAVWASAGDRSAAPASWGSSSLFPSRWRRSRGFLSIPPR